VLIVLIYTLKSFKSSILITAIKSKNYLGLKPYITFINIYLVEADGFIFKTD